MPLFLKLSNKSNRYLKIQTPKNFFHIWMPLFLNLSNKSKNQMIKKLEKSNFYTIFERALLLYHWEMHT